MVNLELIFKSEEKLVKPFIIDSKQKTDGVEKMYLVLLYFEPKNENTEQVRDFAFITGRQIKTTMKYHLTPISIATIEKNPKITSVDEDVKKKYI